MIFLRTNYVWVCRSLLLATDIHFGGFIYHCRVETSTSYRGLIVRQEFNGSLVRVDKYYVLSSFHPVQIILDYFMQELGICLEFVNGKFVVDGNDND